MAGNLGIFMAFLALLPGQAENVWHLFLPNPNYNRRAQALHLLKKTKGILATGGIQFSSSNVLPEL